MDQKRLSYLFEQDRRNRCTPQEQAELDEWYDSLDDPDFVPQYKEGTPEAEAYVAEQTAQIMRRINRRKSTKGINFWAKIAAVLVMGMVIAYLVWPEPKTAINKSYAYAQQAAQYNRYLILPDSSTVILGQGSSFEISQGFGTADRSVTLRGEAYFDVKRNTALPFVIHSGKTTTTVLGTAFNIRQRGDSVAITVTRGKVQVASEGKVLAVLTPGQQLATNVQTQVATLNNTHVAEVTEWIEAGLHFNNITLGEAVAQLRQRYSADIALATPGIEQCVVTVVTPFNGTESLEAILNVVCATLNARYTVSAGKIEITGEPCNRE